MTFEIVGKIITIERIASTKSIRDINRLNNQYGLGKWRKLKGKATVKFSNGMTCKAEVHWYEAHGIGKRKMKVKRIIEG
ncbi:MAG: hypothetical protein OMM_09327 [Candidatus Magnetoglobus multicellularis str. Araruama]|uniref:Uncharacterized protein n=1 Tax=Candidatus Magnetoglobus multicellularis str. Araruama TaxID=890399 RepID=A0A1V1P4L7_9BACT|nr:MAG: hypothetical protein OMM_09327 [Candidatus Magnetoglobus multicellularis str. Araruama]